MVDLTTCEFCGGNVHRESAYCPACGVPGPGASRQQRDEWVHRLGASPRGDGGALALKERPTETAVSHPPAEPVEPDERDEWPQVVVEHHYGNGLAVASFVLGIVGIVLGIIPILFFLSLPCGVLALVFGVVGRRKALNSEHRGGKRLALTGVALGCLTVVMGIAGIVVLDDAVDDLRDHYDRLDAELEAEVETLQGLSF